METLEYRTADKSSWGQGPWQTEPDKKQWQDIETGYPCLIVRNNGGALCGYVGVPKEHPAHGRDYWPESDSVEPIDQAIRDIEVHGGLTFADSCQHGDDSAHGICHIPGEGEPDNVWWFGFDCAHCLDFSPAHEMRNAQLGLGPSLSSDGVYRKLAYVEAKVASLACQLKQIEQTA